MTSVEAALFSVRLTEEGTFVVECVRDDFVATDAESDSLAETDAETEVEVDAEVEVEAETEAELLALSELDKLSEADWLTDSLSLVSSD
ncbi:TPA: hypothetical protein TZS69_000302 [Streptococcus suis]|nr:hypothetical protein [Streptococcus suis]